MKIKTYTPEAVSEYVKTNPTKEMNLVYISDINAEFMDGVSVKKVLAKDAQEEIDKMDLDLIIELSNKEITFH